VSITDDICQLIDEQRGRIADVALQIHARPELAYEEKFASDLIARELERDGLFVERSACGVDTALRARFGKGSGPTVAILAEYDALPEIGHACGHNLIAAGAFGAALALYRVRDRLPGDIVFLGTPAEEGGGGKIRMLNKGAFTGVDAAMMYHPFDRTMLWQGALAMNRVEVTYRGKASHAAAAPWDGSSALRAVIQLFNLLDSARVHLQDGARLHGIITDGGQAVNIIPERASAAFSVRAPTAAYLQEVMTRFRRCAEAAAMATDTKLELAVKTGYKDMRNCLPLARRFGQRLKDLGVPFVETDPTSGQGSTDMGDVSHVVPSIHPYLSICDVGEAMCHQHGFTERSGSGRGIAAAVTAAKAMALTALDVLSDETLRQDARSHFLGAP
jgi:amidohydrolase